METKIIEIKKAICDKEMYPRNLVDWVTSYRYAKAMQSGAKFPPITVASSMFGKLLVIDGFHRLEAYKQNKETHIEVEVLKGLNKKEIFIESVKRNIGHGRQFNSQERTRIILTLEKWKMSQEIISEIIRIPTDDIQPFVSKRITRITETQEEIPLKSIIRNLSKTDVNEEPEQDYFAGRHQLQILNTLIILLENKYIDTNSQIINEKLNQIHKLLEDYIKK